MAKKGNGKGGGKLSHAKRAILYYDLESTGTWTSLGPEEISEVEAHCHDFFVKTVSKHKCDSFTRERFRGDDAIAYFSDETDCVNAAIELFKEIPEMIRRAPHIKHAKIRPRIIMFSDTISGDYSGVYTGRNIREILPQERAFGKAGTLRIVGDDFHYQLNSAEKNQFARVPGTVQGKRGIAYEIYEFQETLDLEQTRKRYLPPYIPKLQESLYKFYSNNIATRNTLTLSLTKKAAEGSLQAAFSKVQFTQTVLNSCRAYLELTVSGSLPDDGSWKFKTAYWEYDKNGDELAIISYSYPKGVSCISYLKQIKVKNGDNIVGDCFKRGEVVIMNTLDADYRPLHTDRKNQRIATIAAFPVVDPVVNAPAGVLTIDTRVEGYFTKKFEEIGYHLVLLSSFTSNLALAGYLK